VIRWTGKGLWMIFFYTIRSFVGGRSQMNSILIRSKGYG
jgi:hypothetical protein